MKRVGTLAGMVWLEMLRRKDLYVLLVLLSGALGLLGSVDLFGFGGVTGHVKDVGLLAVWVLGWVLALGTAVRQLPEEEQRGTIFAMLAKPVSRWELVLGKWLGTWLVVSCGLVLFYAVLWAVVVLRGGGCQAVAMLQAVWLHSMAVAVLSAIGLACATRLNPDAALALAYVLTGTAFLIVPQVPRLLMRAGPAAGTALMVLYFACPHLELFDLRQRLIHGWGPARWRTVAEVTLYGAIFAALFVLLAWLGYRRKRFVRGRLS